MDLELDKIAARIRTQRESKGLSQETVAQKAGLSKNHLSNVERGVGENIGISTFNSIAHALDVPVDYILFGQIYAPNTDQYEQIRSKIMVGTDLLPITPEEREILLDIRSIDSKKQRASIKEIIHSLSNREK